MRDRPVILWGLALLLVILTTPFWHGVLAHTGGAAPAIPPAKGAHCVRPANWMVKNHMKLLMRLRYEAVHEGIRHPEESLTGCINCHVSRLPDGKYPSVTSRKFFCNACHEYAGVHIDCFSCHTNRPQSGSAAVAQAAAEWSFEARDAVVVPGQAQGAAPAVSAAQVRSWRSRFRGPP